MVRVFFFTHFKVNSNMNSGLLMIVNHLSGNIYMFCLRNFNVLLQSVQMSDCGSILKLSLTIYPLVSHLTLQSPFPQVYDFNNNPNRSRLLKWIK